MGGKQEERGWRDNGTLLDFNHILVFDPASGDWFDQRTSGGPPSPRMDFRTACLSTDDAYEMYAF